MVKQDTWASKRLFCVFDVSNEILRSVALVASFLSLSTQCSVGHLDSTILFSKDSTLYMELHISKRSLHADRGPLSAVSSSTPRLPAMEPQNYLSYSFPVL